MTAFAAVICTVHKARSLSFRGYGNCYMQKTEGKNTRLVTPAPIGWVSHSLAVVRRCEQQTLTSQMAVAAVVESSKGTLMQSAHTCSPAEADSEAAAHKPLCNSLTTKLPADEVVQCIQAKTRQSPEHRKLSHQYLPPRPSRQPVAERQRHLHLVSLLAARPNCIYCKTSGPCPT